MARSIVERPDTAFLRCPNGADNERAVARSCTKINKKARLVYQTGFLVEASF
jgi:hypothetical protein